MIEIGGLIIYPQYIIGILYMNTIQPGQETSWKMRFDYRITWIHIRRAQNLASKVRNYYYENLQKSIWEKSFITDLPYGIYTPLRSLFEERTPCSILVCEKWYQTQNDTT